MVLLFLLLDRDQVPERILASARGKDGGDKTSESTYIPVNAPETDCTTETEERTRLAEELRKPEFLYANVLDTQESG